MIIWPIYVHGDVITENMYLRVGICIRWIEKENIIQFLNRNVEGAQNSSKNGQKMLIF